jgi:hypothetical protein
MSPFGVVIGDRIYHFDYVTPFVHFLFAFDLSYGQFEIPHARKFKHAVTEIKIPKGC